MIKTIIQPQRQGAKHPELETVVRRKAPREVQERKGLQLAAMPGRKGVQETGMGPFVLSQAGPSCAWTVPRQQGGPPQK